jgi:hypothetical protein
MGHAMCIGEIRNVENFSFENLKGNVNLEDLGIDG